MSFLQQGKITFPLQEALTVLDSLYEKHSVPAFNKAAEEIPK